MESTGDQPVTSNNGPAQQRPVPTGAGRRRRPRRTITEQERHEHERFRLAQLLYYYRIRKARDRLGMTKEEVVDAICRMTGEQDPKAAIAKAKELTIKPVRNMPAEKPERWARSTGIRSVVTNNVGRGKRSR